MACYDKFFAAQLPSSAVGQSRKPLSIWRKPSAAAWDKAKAVIVVEKGGDALPADSAGETAGIYTPLSLMYGLDETICAGCWAYANTIRCTLCLSWYNNSLTMPGFADARAWYTGKIRTAKRAETKLQVSFKSKIAEDFVRYEHPARICGSATPKDPRLADLQPRRGNPRHSAIRITNLKFSQLQPVEADVPFGGETTACSVQILSHKSNGQSQPESRSWNRIYAIAGMEWGQIDGAIRNSGCVRSIRAAIKTTIPILPTIWGMATWSCSTAERRSRMYSVLRYNPKTGWRSWSPPTFPIKGKLKGVVRGFRPQQSLIHYNHKQNGINDRVDVQRLGTASEPHVQTRYQVAQAICGSP